MRHARMLLGAVCFFAVSDATFGNDLLDAYQQALERDAVLRSAAFQKAGADEVLPQAWATFVPQVTSNVDAGRERLTYLGTLQPPNAIARTATIAATGNVATYSVTLSQTVWSLEGLRHVQEAGLQVAQAQAVYSAQEENLILRVAQAYFGILSAADKLATTQSQRDAFGELLRQAQVREQQGLSASIDVSEAQSFYDGTEQAVIDAENDLEDAKRAMGEITGRYPESAAPLQEDIPLIGPMPDSADEWALAAQHDNLDVQAADLAVQAAERNLQAQRAKYWPTLSLQGALSHTDQPESLGGNQGLDAVQMQLSWPIYQGTTVRSLVRQSSAAYEQAKAQLDQTQRHAERLARLAFRSVATGVVRVQAARRAVESGRKAVESSRLGVEFGSRNEFDLLNQQNNYYAAIRAYRQSRYDYLTAVLQLEQQAGRLHQTDLAHVDELLVRGSPGAAP
jgi:outer membrane protein